MILFLIHILHLMICLFRGIGTDACHMEQTHAFYHAGTIV